MNLRDSIKSGFQNYANFKGRAGRSEFWFWVLFFWIATAIGIILDAILFPGVSTSSNSGIGQAFLPLNLITYALLVPNIAVFIRRLHDIDRKGWWFFVGFVPFGGIILLVWLCTRGTDRENRFGSTKDNIENID